MKDKIKFLKIYAIFFFSALLVNLSLEIGLRLILWIPEPLDVRGIIIFFSLFSIFGALIFFYKNYEAKKMGLLSLLFGQICEFTFMKPEWVQNFYALKINMDAIMPFILSCQQLLTTVTGLAIMSNIILSFSFRGPHPGRYTPL